MSAKARKAVSVAAKALPLAVPEVAAPLAIAQRAGEIATGDIVVIRSTRPNPRSTEKKPLPPIETETHVNLAAVGLGILGTGLGALAAVIAWNGVSTFGGGLPGLRDTIRGEKRSALDDAIAAWKAVLHLP